MSKFLLFYFLFITSLANATETQFFQKYIELNDSFDTSVIELYSNNATIQAFRRYPHGLELSMELTGEQWKTLIIKVMPLAKKLNDKSTFSKIKISKHGNLVTIEEYSESQPQSSC